jgi:hypothetical protein
MVRAWFDDEEITGNQIIPVMCMVPTYLIPGKNRMIKL